MVSCASDTLVSVYPFIRQPDGEDVVIGRSDTGVFLVLPLDAVELLDYLSEGKTVGQAQSLYQEKYGEVPDINELLEVLELNGLVQILGTDKYELTATLRKTNSQQRSAQPKPIRYHFSQFPQALAQKIFSRQVLIGSGVVIGLGLLAVTIDPSIIPGWKAYFFKENVTLMLLLLTLINFTAVFLHEMAHLIAARAVGVSCRLGFSNRLWILVAETDMTGVWGVPRSQRYLPFLAGPLLDAVSASILLLVLFAQKQSWFALHPVIFQLAQTMLLSYLLALLWQCYFFVRTDFYYVIANFFNCKSLMKDTGVFLQNQMPQFIRRTRKIDQSHIPAAEMRAIRWYALIYVLGRIVAGYCLILISIPLMWNYLVLLVTTLSAGYQANPYAFMDALVIVLLSLPLQVAGLWLWIRSSRNNKRK
ncbi:MAG: hypothetical protein KME08_09160 [Aphanothece sp. CMT-3BRIN-NPC111]|nr:hypothetical protein [Aphanothece sp. CMT-3BRIN-NPC111]